MTTPEEVLEQNYHEFIESFITDLRDLGLTLDDGCKVWELAFGQDSCDPLVDAAMENHYEWAYPDL